jgi:hypothetical protein
LISNDIGYAILLFVKVLFARERRFTKLVQELWASKSHWNGNTPGLNRMTCSLKVPSIWANLFSLTGTGDEETKVYQATNHQNFE